jgi:hypothetical protein
MEGGLRGITVSIAFVLVTLPTLLVTLTAKREALSTCLVAGVIYDPLVAPVMFAPFCFQ